MRFEKPRKSWTEKVEEFAVENAKDNIALVLQIHKNLHPQRGYVRTYADDGHVVDEVPARYVPKLRRALLEALRDLNES
jgi:hypothetical protein